MTLSEFKTQSANVYAQLFAGAQTMRQQFELARGWTMADSVESSVESALKTIDAAVQQLAPGGSITARVLNGEKSAQWWDEQANTARDSIAYVGRTIGEAVPSWQRIKGEIIDPTAKEFVTEVAGVTEAAASLLPWWAPWAVGGGLTLGVLILAGAYLPKPRA